MKKLEYTSFHSSNIVKKKKKSQLLFTNKQDWSINKKTIKINFLFFGKFIKMNSNMSYKMHELKKS